MSEQLPDVFEAYVAREIELVFLVDTSGSMCGEPMHQLNAAMSEAVTAAEEAACEREIDMHMRVIEFNSVANWIIGDIEHGVGHIDWVPLAANGGTNTAVAIDLAASVMNRNHLGPRNLRPVVILDWI